MWRYKFNILPVLACLIHYGTAMSRIDPLVDTKVGLIRGLRATDGDYAMFMGIPYATVDGANPFGPSEPHPGFDEPFDAYDDSAVCPQVDEFTDKEVGSIDCLHLNVYVPNTANSKNRLPVLVWIYGGAFKIGYSGRFLYGPRYLVKQDLILVTINYRVGPYGFMCLDVPEVPGNQGLKDQQLALKWIKNNIEAFGGNPDQITIFGESAGGSSVDFQSMYSQEKLFNQVIMQSGVALAPWAVGAPEPLVPLKIAKQLGFETTDTKEALSFLASIDTDLVIAAGAELKLSYNPCVENDFDNVTRFIHDFPLNIKKPNLGNLPTLLGVNKDEGLADFRSKTAEEISQNSEIFLEYLNYYFNFNTLDLNEMEQIVRNFYIGDEIISENVVEGLIKVYSDLFFNYPTARTLQKYLDNGLKNIYYYLFSYDGERNFVKNRLNVTVPGASHADEIGYLFDISYMDKNPAPEDQLVIDRMTTLWANFVKFGNPTPQTTEILPVQWPAATKDSQYYLNIDADLTVGKRYFNSRIAFWELFYKLNEKAQIGYKARSK
ncbi:juvenile hormone esterase-like [Trichoplusia ni]|uniref:Carboxylic ester hydrolase n=1 Tax=Trichoplusia ni TaxID=7111 RepID=A0A7E5WFG0_TRINI|nr:juvenile hormone esterase-like [Trichoplusia ni]